MEGAHRLCSTTFGEPLISTTLFPREKLCQQIQFVGNSGGRKKPTIPDYTANSRYIGHSFHYPLSVIAEREARAIVTLMAQACTLLMAVSLRSRPQ